MSSEARYEEKCKSAVLKFSVQYRKRSRYQDIIVARSPCYGKMLILDGEIQFAEKDEYVFHEMLTYPLFALRKIREVLILGGGDGLAAREVLKLGGNPTIVELDEEVIRVSSKHFKDSRRALSKANVVIGDALKFKPQKKYDAVIVDLIDVYANPSLYSPRSLKRFISYGKRNALFMFHSDSSVYERMKKSLKKVFPSIAELSAYIPTFFSEWVFYIANAPKDWEAKLRKTRLKGKYFSAKAVKPFIYIPTMKIQDYRVKLKA